MRVPNSSNTPKHFSFKRKQIRYYAIPNVLLGFQIENWDNVNELSKLHLSLNTIPELNKSRTKWIKAFREVEKKFRRIPSVIDFGKRMADYLEHPVGKRSYEEAFVEEQIALESESIKRKQHLISGRTRRKIRVLESLKVEKEIDQEIETFEAPPSQEKDSTHTQDP